MECSVDGHCTLFVEKPCLPTCPEGLCPSTQSLISSGTVCLRFACNKT